MHLLTHQEIVLIALTVVAVNFPRSTVAAGMASNSASLTAGQRWKQSKFRLLCPKLSAKDLFVEVGTPPVDVGRGIAKWKRQPELLVEDRLKTEPCKYVTHY